MKLNSGMTQTYTQEFTGNMETSVASSTQIEMEALIRTAIKEKDSKELLFLVATYLQRHKTIDFIRPESLYFVEQKSLKAR